MRILLVEALADHAAEIRIALRSSGLEAPDLTWVDQMPQALTRLGAETFDVVLVDVAGWAGRGLEFLSRLRLANRRVPIVALANVDSETLALQALRAGAQDHLLLQQLRMDFTLLGRTVTYAMERQAREAEIDRRRHEADVLAAMARSLNSTLDVAAILRDIVDGTRELCRADLVAIGLVDAGGDEAAVRYAVGEGAADWTGRRLRAGDTEWAGALDAGRLVHTELDAGSRAVRLLVSIVSQEGFEGVLAAENHGGREFSDHDELMLLRLADAAAIALRNARLYTGERDARAAAEASEARVRVLFRSAPVPMWLCDATTLAFVAVNDAAVAHYGYSEAEFTAMRGPDLRSTGDPAPEAGAGERHRTKDGRLIDVEIATHPMTVDGRSMAFSVVTDVTARRRAEEAVRESDERLRRAERLEAASRLAGTVAHDLKDLITVIEGHVELARDTAGRDAGLEKHFEAIHAASVRVATLTARLAAFGQRQTLHPVALDVAGMVRELAPVLCELAGEHIRCSVHAAPGLPAVHADPTALEEVVVNLVVNARDAMPEGGHLMVEVLAAPDRVLVAVSDTGPGMTPEVRARIFEPLVTTRADADDRGWGLATAHGLVKQSGGEIVVYSEAGRGTTVKVYLVAAQAAAGGDPGRVPVRGDETILVIDDEPQVRQLAVDVLEAYGYRVLEARSPAEALALAERHAGSVDLLLTDVIMPELTGPEIARRLREARPGLRVLYMSGYTDAALAQHGLALAGDAVLEKPFSPDELAIRVRAAIDRAAPET